MMSYECKILGLYHVLMYVCRLHRFVVPRFFLLVQTSYVCRPTCFFVLRSYVCKILGLNHVLMYVLMYLDYWFLLPTIFMLVLNSHVCGILRFFACTEFLRMKVKYFIPIKNKMCCYDYCYLETTWPFRRAHRFIIIFWPDNRKNVIFIAFSDSS